MAESAGQRRFWHILLRRRGLLIPPALLILAILPRLSAFWQGFVTPDESLWLYNSARFWRAVETRQWADTLQAGEPGVTTMWAGGLSILYAQRQNPTIAAAHLAWIAPVSQFDPENVALAVHLVPFLPAARLILATLNALGVLGIYFLARRLWGELTALLAALLIAFDPFTVALSGLFHTAALMTTLTALSLLAWFNLFKLPGDGTDTRRHGLSNLVLSLLSGLCAGAAILSHTSALAVIPAALLSTGIWLLLSKNRPFKTVLLSGMLWIIGLLAVVFGAFPAMWIDPLGTATGVYAMLIRHPQATQAVALDGNNSPSWSYLTACLLRLTPVTLIGLALSFGAPLLDRRNGAAQRRFVYALGWLGIAAFVPWIDLDPLPAERHLLPLFPMLNTLAAIGWSEAVRWPFSLRRQATPPTVQAGIALILLLTQSAAILTGYPYYLDTYNPLVGGLETAMHMLPVGQGEGMEQIAAYLNRLPNAETVIVATTNPISLAPLFNGQTLALDGHSHLLADYLVVTVHDRQTNATAVEATVGNAQVIHTVSAGNVPILWLYRTAYTAEATHLAQFVAPTDLILCDAPTPFARHTTDALPTMYVVADADESEIVAMLNRWRALHTRLWYIASPAASPITAQAIRRQLDTYAVRLDHAELGYVTITLYILPDEADFRPLRTIPGRLGAVNLSGAALIQADLPADGRVELVLRWRAETSPAADLFPFIHLLDQAGHRWAVGGGDERLLDRRGYPTSAWRAGENAEQPFTLALPPGVPPGRYLVHVGLTDTPGHPDGSTVLAAQVELGPAQTPPLPDTLELVYRPSVTWRGRLKLFGVDLPTRATAGQTVVVGIGWTATDRLDERYSIRLNLEGADGRAVTTPTAPLSRFPTDQWRRGETLRELYDLALPADMPAGRYALSIQVFNAADVALSPPVSLAEITIGAE